MTVKWQSHAYVPVVGSYHDYGYPTDEGVVQALTDMFAIWVDAVPNRRAWLINATPLLNCSGADLLQAAYPGFDILGALIAEGAGWSLKWGAPSPPGTLICRPKTRGGEQSPREPDAGKEHRISLLVSTPPTHS